MMPSKIEILEQAMAAGRVKPIPGLSETMAAYETALDDISARPLIAAEKARLKAEANAALHAKVSELVERARTEALKPYEREEGDLRRAARADGRDASESEIRSQVFRHQRAMQLSDQAERANTPKEVRAVYEAAQLTADPDAIRLVGRAGQARLKHLAREDAGREHSALRNESAKFDGEFSAWEKANPSLVQRLAEIERQRGNTAIEFAAGAEFALELFGIAQPPLVPVTRE